MKVYVMQLHILTLTLSCRGVNSCLTSSQECQGAVGEHLQPELHTASTAGMYSLCMTLSSLPR